GLHPLDLVFLEEELDAFRESGDDLVLAGLHLIHVDADCAFADRDTPLLDVLHDLERVGVLEQGLGRYAPPDQTGAPERLLFPDDCCLESQLRCPNRGDVAAGSRADYHHVELVRHVRSRLRADCAPRYGVAGSVSRSLRTPLRRGRLRFALTAHSATAWRVNRATY